MPARRRFVPPTVCPVCGEDDIPRHARACPGCGADERSGWGLDADAHDGEGDAFDHDAFVRDEFGDGPRRLRPAHVSAWWWVVGIVVVLLLAWGYVNGGWR